MRGHARSARIEAQPAYVLHRRAWRETSALLEVFTAEYGRVGLVVRGLRGPRSQVWQALLQPTQAVLLSWSGNGELPQVTHVEAAEQYLDLRGEAVLAGLYLNELILALLPRHEAQVELFLRYGECLRQQLSTDQVQRAWHLRLFERDLLAALGFALQLDRDRYGDTLHPDARYRYHPERGAVRDEQGAAVASLPGALLIGLREGMMPDANDVRACRHWLRDLLAQHLGGRELNAWSLMQEVRAI